MGYYDRFLKRLFATPDISRDAVTLVGLAFHEQMVADDELPMDDHDFLLDQVITSDWSENKKGTRFQMKRFLTFYFIFTLKFFSFWTGREASEEENTNSTVGRLYIK